MVPQRARMRWIDPRAAMLGIWISHETAQLDHFPGHRIPVSPGALRLVLKDAGHHLRHGSENLWHPARHVVVAQDVPFGEAAHHRGTHGVDDAA